jgi:hypothetical protein
MNSELFTVHVFRLFLLIFSLSLSLSLSLSSNNGSNSMSLDLPWINDGRRPVDRSTLGRWRWILPRPAKSSTRLVWYIKNIIRVEILVLLVGLMVLCLFLSFFFFSNRLAIPFKIVKFDYY